MALISITCSMKQIRILLARSLRFASIRGLSITLRRALQSIELWKITTSILREHKNWKKDKKLPNKNAWKIKLLKKQNSRQKIKREKWPSVIKERRKELPKRFNRIKMRLPLDKDSINLAFHNYKTPSSSRIKLIPLEWKTKKLELKWMSKRCCTSSTTKIKWWMSKSILTSMLWMILTIWCSLNSI